MKVVLKCKLCGEILSISDTDIIGSCSCGETYIDFKEKEIIIGSKTGKSAFRFNGDWKPLWGEEIIKQK